MPVIQGVYATPISGIPFPMVTASGTYAANYDTVQMSAVLSKDGGAWASLSGRISGIPGNGVYTLVSLSSSEMTCRMWAIKVGAASGCLDQTIIGQNSPIDTSAIASQIWNSLTASYTSTPTFGGAVVLSGEMVNVSGLNNLATATNVSGLPGILANTSNLIAQTSSVLNAVSSVTATVNVSAVASQVWNTVISTSISSNTFGGAITLSGDPVTLAPINHVSSRISIVDAATTVSSAIDVATAMSSVWNYGGGLSSRFITGGSVAATATVDYSGIASQVWNTVTANNTSSTTFGGAVLLSGQGGTATVNLSDIACQVWLTKEAPTRTSALAALPYSTYGLTNASGTSIDRITYGINEAFQQSTMAAIQVYVSALVDQCSNILNAVSNVTATVNYSSVATQVWNTVMNTATSNTTFGGFVQQSGLVTVSGLNLLATPTNVSALAGVLANTSSLMAQGSSIIAGTSTPVTLIPGQTVFASGLSPILAAVSGLNTSGLAQSGVLAIVSGLNNLATLVSVSSQLGIIANTSTLIGNTSNILANTSAISLKVSGVATLTSVSGLPGIATSGTLSIVSGLNNLATLISVSSQLGIIANTSSLIAQGSSIVTGISNITATVNYSSIAAQVWNSLTNSYTSAPTFGGAVVLSGELVNVSGLNNLATITSVSSLAGILANTSSLIAQGSSIVTGISNVTATVNYSSIANQVWNTLLNTATSATTFGGQVQTGATVNISAIAAQTWNTLTTTATSATTFGGAVVLSGNLVQVSGLSNLATPTNVSALAGVLANTSTIIGNTSNILANQSSISLKVSGLATLTSVSGIPGIATSGTLAIVSGLNNLATLVSVSSQLGIIANTSSLIAQGSSIVTGISNITATVNYSSIASQVWNSLTASYTSAPTFGGAVVLSGELVNVSGLNNLATPTNVSSLAGILANTSSLIAQGSSIVTGISNITATVNYSSVAAQVWNTLTNTATSATTFGGAVVLSGSAGNTSAVAGQVWNSLMTTYASAPTFGGFVQQSGLVTVSGLDKIMTAVSGLNTSGLAQSGVFAMVSGLGNILTAVSGLNTSGLAQSGVTAIVSGLTPILTAVSGLNTSGLAQSGVLSIVSGLNNLATFTGVSGLATLTSVSSLPGILSAVSGVISGVATIPTAEAQATTSGTLAHDLKLLREMWWNDWNIDKTYTPNRLYVGTNFTNFSHYFELTDDANNTKRTRGG